MPSDSIAGFLDHAQANRVLFPEQVEQLIRQPDIPQSDLSSLCSYLLERGVLTQFQADAIREGRGQDLSFSGYPVIDVIGPCPGGTAYRALHPSLRTPVILRRLDNDAFAPTDTAVAVVNRARALATLPHPNLLPVLDAGIYQDQAYAVLDQPAGAADLGTLLKEVGGAMPGFLAAEYGWSLASALQLIHEHGGWHGEVRPDFLLVGPLSTKTGDDGTPRRRPAPNATVKLTEPGLIPMRPPAAQAALSLEALPYLPPERIDGAIYDARSDLYGLGACLYLLLAGRPVHAADTAEELLNKIRTAEPAALASLRPDVPADLSAVVMRMIAKRPEDRPQTAQEVEVALAPYCRPATLPAAQTSAIPTAALSLGSDVPVAQAVPVAVPVTEPDGWGVNPNAFAEAHAASAADTSQPRRRQLTDKDKSRSKMWIAIGLCLHLTAVGLLIAWATGVFTPDPEPEPPKIDKKDDKKKTNPPRVKP